jgi:hypothetical protein
MQPGQLEGPAPAPSRPYGTDTAAIIDAYPEFGIFAFPYGMCGARPKRDDGSVFGDLMTATSLDELAGKMDRCRRLLAGM